MKTESEVIKSILRITGLTLVIVVISGTIWYVRFGPEAEVDPTFPRESLGTFLKSPTVTTDDQSAIVSWAIRPVCKINEVEFQEENPVDKDSWMGGTATCAKNENDFSCIADLTERSLSTGVNYRLQAHHAQCTDGNQYVSTVTDFSL